MTSIRAALAGAALLLMTGCAVHPGAAAVVGDHRIATSEVENFATGFCQFTAQPGRAAIPMSQLLDQSVNQLVLTQLQTSFAESQKVDFDHAALQSAMATVRDRLGGVAPEQRELFLAQVKQIVTGELTQRAIGEKSLVAQGVKNPGADRAASEGAKLLEDWRLKSGIKVYVDPRYNPGQSGQAGGGDGSISRRVSKFAKSSVGGQDATFATSLPANQVCSTTGK